ncbi:L-threonylcarbamoyladenylate synthase [Desulfomonile tiedjei]|uniref:L-threonylcarbamoyladenylate synthase n=1 Tax=Desulfomonile tiedjei (strain ATCC 49306 / DSM 6799 / DCB-1) TaxID=706587 RepID=I4C833_DESTA|nr:L-threonylcarbamoyladenylate synthase [Desulfomonile tiedjei]AFM25724.1 translation factor SUA5 [Desulfomonile tiedjei DSM 6799]
MPQRPSATPNREKMNLDAQDIFAKARDVIRSGGVVIVPTETFYGLAVAPFNDEAVRRVFSIKSRPIGSPLPLIASDRKTVEKSLISSDSRISILMDRFWPGSLTLVLQLAAQFAEPIFGASGKVGVRVPPDSAARKLAELAGGFITATSANFAGDPPPGDVRKIPAALISLVDLVIDLGPTPGGKPSTVIEIDRGVLKVIREGAVPIAAIRSVLEASP